MLFSLSLFISFFVVYNCTILIIIIIIICPVWAPGLQCALIHLLSLALYKFFVCLLKLLPYFLIYFLSHLLSYLCASFRIGPFRFQAGGRRRRPIRPYLALVFLFISCYSIFCYCCIFAFVMFDLVFQCYAKRLAGKNVSKMTYFVSGGT